MADMTESRALVPPDIEEITAFIRARGTEAHTGAADADYEVVRRLTAALDHAVAHLGGQAAYERQHGVQPRAAILWESLTGTAALWEDHPDFNDGWR